MFSRKAAAELRKELEDMGVYDVGMDLKTMKIMYDTIKQSKETAEQENEYRALLTNTNANCADIEQLIPINHIITNEINPKILNNNNNNNNDTSKDGSTSRKISPPNIDASDGHIVEYVTFLSTIRHLSVEEGAKAIYEQCLLENRQRMEWLRSLPNYAPRPPPIPDNPNEAHGWNTDDDDEVEEEEKNDHYVTEEEEEEYIVSTPPNNGGEDSIAGRVSRSRLYKKNDYSSFYADADNNNDSMDYYNSENVVDDDFGVALTQRKKINKNESDKENVKLSSKWPSIGVFEGANSLFDSFKIYDSIQNNESIDEQQQQQQHTIEQLPLDTTTTNNKHRLIKCNDSSEEEIFVPNKMMKKEQQQQQQVAVIKKCTTTRRPAAHTIINKKPTNKKCVNDFFSPSPLPVATRRFYEQFECPLCLRKFSKILIQKHAANCIGSSSSKEKSVIKKVTDKSTTTTTGQLCIMCDKYIVAGTKHICLS